ncbi:MAG TPA: acetylornithine transaminase, partial [Solirubrobacterales bacterium]
MSDVADGIGLEETRALEERYLMRTYKRAPVDFVRGEGPLLWDADGKRYLDFLSGISVCSVGHCHPEVVKAVREQSHRLMHTSNLFYTEPMAQLAQRLSESSLGGRVFFANSGTEANECAIKVARKHAHRRGIRAPEIVSFENDFHGRTYGALSATPGLAANEALGPMLPGFRSVPHNDAAALREAVGENTAAVLIEPIQGEAGVVPTSEEALLAAREACDEVGALLILDEIQTGLGRTGSLWAFEQTPVRPDVLTTAKALGGGFPIGACITAPVAADVLETGDHGSTFAGGPVATAAALAVLDIVEDPVLLRHVRELGAYLRERL